LIGLPSFLLRLFGKPKAKQPTIEELNPTNRNGITDYGRYERSNSFNSKAKEMLLSEIEISAVKLNKQIDKRTEEELDSFRVIFGGMSLRTFIYFLLKHNLHHTGVVRKRLEK